MRLKLHSFLTILTLLFFVGVNSQTKKWSLISKKTSNFTKNELKFRKHYPSKSKVYSLNYNDFKNSIINVSSKGNKIVELPTEIGLQKFSVREASSMAPELSAKFPMIKSYVGQGIDDKSQVTRFSLGTDGLHAVIYTVGKQTYYIDPYTSDNNNYLTYSRGSLSKIQSDFECLVEEQVESSQIKQEFSNRNADDGLLRTFRLAIVCSGEYAQFHLNNQGVSSGATDAVKKAAVLSAMNTSMTRINGVYERDLGVKMEIVANNDDVIFLDASTDGITDGSASTMINEVQTICDNQIGSENYDIGHIFSIGGSGLAGLGVVCVNGQKARGVTGIATPMGDPYDIDYVSHEMGHQFGANHTQNNNCNRNNGTAVEPGSASTIMGYAGICAPNVQNNSDDHFHAVSIDEMWSTIQSSATCAVTSSLGNTAPTANAGADYTIPKSTPFVLRGIGMDANTSDVLSYNWEQTDTEIATMPPLATNTGGPAFRSNPSSTSPNRYMPALATVVAGNTSSTWEVVPSVARELNFSLVVRDNYAGGGNSARDNMKVTVDDASGPFVVTSPNSAVSWDVGTDQTITWDVAGTNASPINVTKVNIKLSEDGGLTFPITIASNVDNDGSETVTIPENATTNARIMIEAVDNIFYAVSSTDFTIVLTDPTFIISNTNGNQTVCNSEAATATYNFDFNYVNGFTEAVTLSATNNPAGSTVVFSPTTISSNGTFTMTVNNLENIPVNEYTINVKGTSATITREKEVELKVYSSNFTPINLSEPANTSINVVYEPVLRWATNSNATSYIVEIATDMNFTNMFLTNEVSTNSHAVSTELSPSTVYYWRVKGKNLCGESDYSSTYSFTTQNCSICDSSATSSGQTSTTLVSFNTINNTSAKPAGYSDYKTIKTDVLRGENHQITVNVNTDGLKRTQTKVWIDWNQNCDFNDAGEEYDLGSAEDNANIATSLSSLTITVPATAFFGETVMRVTTQDVDPFAVTYPTSCRNGFVGEVEDYTINVFDNTASIEDFAFSGFNLYPNPTNGTFTLNLDVLNTDKVAVQLFDVRGRLIGEKEFLNTKTNFSENIFFEKAASGLYLLKVTNGNKQTTRKLIIE